MISPATLSVVDDWPIEEAWGTIVDNIKNEYLSEQQSYPWIVGFSGGKDSTVVTHAIFEALLQISPSRRVRPIHIVSNDTMVESPLVIAHLDVVSERIRQAAHSLDLPITVARTKPDPDKTFWALLIGKGYPSPNMTMRWCTDRLKIQPTSSYIKEQASQSGAAIVVLGFDGMKVNLASVQLRNGETGGAKICHPMTGFLAP
ncbi:hypothetical protein [Mesorhizobium sp.]|uniref:hypothetical protein n=1 Tax=Mesorhizobium sp. TaxID=1871066 RepID=UPI00257C9676|nr:hypothetical protein [Mesorhizobium sp.]